MTLQTARLERPPASSRQAVPRSSALSLADIRALPKIDLHRHLVGSIRPDVLVRTAASLGIRLPDFGRDIASIESTSILTAARPGNYQDFFRNRVWGLFKYIFRDPRGCAQAIYHAVADAAEDGVIYVEFRVSPYGIEPLDLTTFLDALRTGIRDANQEYPEIIVRLVLSIGRRRFAEGWPAGKREAIYARLIRAATRFSDVVVGFDITGDEESYTNDLFVGLAQSIKAAGFKLTVHAGETNDPRSVWEALKQLRADRIGHGLAAAHDATLTNHLAENRVPLEICPTSNCLLRVSPSLDRHPFRALFKAGVVTTVNTDDPVLFDQTTLSREFYSLLAHDQLEPDDIRTICQYSVEASFATVEEQRVLRQRVASGFARQGSTRHIERPVLDLVGAAANTM